MLNEEGRLILTPEAWKTIQAVQRSGNKIVWTSDDDTWGMVEKWTFPKEVGRTLIEDCDGITLWKMRELIKFKIDIAPLLFTVCLTETGEGHAVLCVATDRGDFILDNRHDEVMAYDKLRKMGYQFLYRSRLGKKMTDTWDIVE